jgi:uncharacterized protein (TIGR03000 family)
MLLEIGTVVAFYPFNEQRRAELMIDLTSIATTGQSRSSTAWPVTTLKGGTDMFRRMVTRMRIFALAGLSLFYVGGPAKAQQGWPIAGANWDLYGGGGRGGSSWSSSESYAPSYPSSSYYAAYPSSLGTYSSYYYGSSGSEGYYNSSTAASSKKRSAVINLRVLSDAKVWFDQSQMKQTGTMRSFESPPLDVGSEYAYHIRIQSKRDGKDITETRQVTLHAGDVINLTLGSPPEVAPAR